MTTHTVLGPAGAPMRPPWGSFAGKPSSGTDSKTFVRQFTVLGPSGATMRTPWGSFAGKVPAAPVVAQSVGGSISGGHFSRGRWRAMVNAQIERAEEHARHLKHKRHREALIAAARAAEEFLEGLPTEADSSAQALATAMQAAVQIKDADSSIQRLHQVRAEAIRLKQLFDDDEEVAILMLLS